MSTRRLLVAGVLVALVLAGVVSGYASGHPDGLESVAATHGFAHTAGEPLTGSSPWADYPSGWAGLGGCALVLALAIGAGAARRTFTRR